MLRVIFFGTPHFSAKILSFLLEKGVEVVAVVTKPDKAKGRSGTPVSTPVKEIALKQQPPLPVFQPEKASDPNFAHLLLPFEPDLFVVVAYGEIIKQHLLDMPKKGCINLHVSLLPKYRGAAPIQRAIIAGEKETGVTVMHMVRKMDAGGMIRQQTLSIGANETFAEVEASLCEIGGPLLFNVLEDFDRGNVQEVQQDESLVTLAPKVELEDCEIRWNVSAEDVHNLVRGVNPYPGAWCWVFVKGEKKRLKIIKTLVLNEEQIQKFPGEILSCTKEGMRVACSEGELCILELQLEGKRPMSPDDCYRGVLFSFIVD